MDDKVYAQEIVTTNPFPGEVLQPATQSSPTSVGQRHTQPVSQTKTFPTKKVAVELLSTALNTRSRKILQQFELQQSGGFQVGNFEEGLSGDIRLTPAGLTARNIAGLTTFVLDGDTGDAVFAGEVKAGAFISGLVIVGDNSVVIDGETKRMVFYDDNGIPAIVIGNV
jgi:hypothetical protein